MHLRLLGPVEAHLDGRTLPLGPPKQRAVLAMLAVRPGHTVSVDELAEGLWGEHPPASAPKMVQLYISHLRRAIEGDGAAIATHGRGYALELADDRVDAVRFERLVDEGKADEALALWHDDPLSDLRSEPFAPAEIRRLEKLRARALEAAVDEQLAAGRHREVLARIDELVAEHPLRERLHAQRMLALYRSGRQADALAAYRGARATLVEEIGVEPGPELRRLHEAIPRPGPGARAALRRRAARTRPAPGDRRPPARPGRRPARGRAARPRAGRVRDQPGRWRRQAGAHPRGHGGAAGSRLRSGPAAAARGALAGRDRARRRLGVDREPAGRDDLARRPRRRRSREDRRRRQPGGARVRQRLAVGR